MLTIGEVATRAGVATSSVRYYERRGLLDADGRQSGQRRYRTPALRRLVFIRMLQDAGLSLDDIAGISNAGPLPTWKAIARRRLEGLDDEIERLEQRPRVPRGRAAVPVTITRRPTARSWAPRSTAASRPAGRRRPDRT